MCAKGSTYSVTGRTSREAHTRGSGQRVGPVEGVAVVVVMQAED